MDAMTKEPGPAEGGSTARETVDKMVEAGLLDDLMSKLRTRAFPLAVEIQSGSTPAWRDMRERISSNTGSRTCWAVGSTAPCCSPPSEPRPQPW